MQIKPFEQISKKDVLLAGGKGASLGEMTQAGIEVPPGFVVLTESFDEFLKETDLGVEIDAILSKVDIEVTHTIDAASEQIQSLILAKEMPEALASEIFERFDNLGAEFVAVRSSATAEDGANAAWAGQLDTFLNTTKDDLIHNVQKCWASLFTPRAIYYRFEKEMHEDHVSVAVVVQKMVNSEKSGIAFSVHPVTQDYDQMIIEAGFGLGEAIVSGQVTPDSYVVRKSDQKILDVNVNDQKKKLVRKGGGGSEWIECGPSGSNQILSEEQILALGEQIIRIEKHYDFPVDVEWAFEDGQFYITQSRPITTLNRDNDTLVIKWEKIISRNIPPLGWSAGATYENEGIKVGPLEWKRNRECILKNNTKQTHVYFDENDICETNILDLIENPRAVQYISKELDEVVSLVDRTFSMKPARTRKKALKLIQKHEWCFGYMLMALDLVTEIGLYIKGKDEYSDADIEKMMKPIKPTLIERENSAIQDLANKDSISTRSLKKLVKEFGFIHQDYMGKPWGTKDYEAAIQSSASKPESSRKESSESSSVTEMTRKLIYIYEEGRNAMVKAVSLILESPYFKGVDRELLLHATSDELKNFTKGSGEMNKKIALGRKNYFALYFDHSDIKIFSTEEEVVDLTKVLGLKKTSVENGARELSGSIANPGIVEGKARLVFTQSDADKVKDGDIIVSPMTAVEFLSGIRRAGAIVTDEGGIICHAAIVSRELGKPCIIGTGNATEVIENGDTLRVDANKGVVSIIK